jgi:2-dehydro-3-deoxyphosphogluconate aldolase/(4S)-4-hydroxy-2-oxoglutarate aldolase
MRLDDAGSKRKGLDLMQRVDTVREIGRRRVSAILRTADREIARRAMQAAVTGGFRMVEFTLTIPGALDLVGEFARDEDLLVGAGTVLTPDQARAAVKAGARFLVSPVVDPAVIRTAVELDVPCVPGAFTPTEMMAATAAGADIVKLFPAPADVAAFVSQVRGPFPELRIYPTAGVTPENFEAVLAAGAFGVGFVTSLFSPADLAAGRFEAIEWRAAEITTRLAAM